MLTLDHKPNSKGNHLLDMVKELGMIVVFMVIDFHVMDMVIELWIAGSLPEEMLVGPTSDVGHVAKLVILLMFVAP